MFLEVMNFSRVFPVFRAAGAVLVAVAVFVGAPVPAPVCAEPAPVVVYSGRGESLVGPLFERYEKETGRRLDVRYNDTAAIATRLGVEGADSAADVVFLQDSGYLGALSKAGLLETLPEETLSAVDPRFRDAEGHWVGTSGRARVMVYSTEAVSKEELPSRLEDLPNAKWKRRLGWAPGNSSFQAHVSVLRHVWGEDKTRSWLEAMKAVDPVVYPKNSPQVIAAANDEIAIGWVNHYYLRRLWEPDMKAANAGFAQAGDAGNVMMVSGVAIRKGSERQQDAERFVAWLVGPSAQQYFAEKTFEYPTRPGVPTDPGIPSLSSLGLAEIDQAWLADVGPTLVLLEELGLQ